MESKELAMQIAKLLDSKKATRVKVLKVRDLTVLADYFVIASGTSSTHVKSLAEEVEFQFKEKGVAPIRTEGFNTQNWFILDYANVIVHVFSPDARDYYDLDQVWARLETLTGIPVTGHLGCGEYLCGQAGFFAAQVLCAGGVPVPLRPGPARGPSAQLHRAGHRGAQEAPVRL